MALPFHTRRLNLPDGRGWIELRGEFDPFEFTEDQRRLIGMMADWFREFEREFPKPSSASQSVEPEVSSSEPT